MSKITFIGAGSTVFAKNILGDVLCTPTLQNFEIALYDIDDIRLKESEMMLNALNQNCNEGRARIKAYLGVEQRKKALRDAKYVINAIQVGGYDPCTITDFEIPKKYGLRQTIADTLGIGGIFRGLRTIPVMFDFAREMEEVCPDAWLFNYTNPMAILSGAMQRYTNVKTVGLCHSVQICAETIMGSVGMDTSNVHYEVAGINHMAWLLSVTRDGVDLYPEIKRRAKDKGLSGEKHDDMVRHRLMEVLGYYITESSEHNAEYTPYWIKTHQPQLIEQYNIPLDEYPRRCIEQIKHWDERRDALLHDPRLDHERSCEYATHMMEAMETNVPFKMNGNVLNNGIIRNLPFEACVEVPCLVDRSGVTPCYVGRLPEHLAALNRTNINPQLLTIEAAVTCKKETIYHAAMLDPHTSAELSIDQIVALCNDMIEAHGIWLPKYH